MVDKVYISINDAAIFLDVNPETLRRWDRSGKLKAEIVKGKKGRQYDLEKLERFKGMVRLGTDNTNEARKKIDANIRSLDEVAEHAKYMFALSENLQACRDLAHFILDDEKESNKYQALMNAFNFVIKKDELKSKMSGTDDKGKEWSYPKIQDFSKEDLQYMREVITKFKHPRITARLSHLLWIIEKDYEMAKIAIQEYLVLVAWLNKKIKEDPESSSAFEISNSLESANILAKKIKHDLASVNRVLADNILNFSDKNPSRYAVTRRLLDLALENKNDFGHDFWGNAVILCNDMAIVLEKDGRGYFAREFLEIAEKIQHSILGSKDQSWRKRIASSLETEAMEKKDSFVQTEVLLKAIKEYKLLRDQSKVDELSKELEKAKKNMKFQTFEQTMDLSEWVKSIRARFKDLLLKDNMEQFLVRLTIDSSILPRYEEVKQQSEKLDKEFPLQALFSHTIFDEEGNSPRKYETDEEKKYLSILRQYGMSMSMSEILLKVLFEEAVEAKKISKESIVEYMIKHLWYGGEYETKDHDTQKVLMKTRKWVDILKPGLYSYISALTLLSQNKTSEARDNLVLAVDSLTLKIEGLIREFYKKIGKLTDRIREKGGKQITEKKGIDELLREPFAKEIFGDDLLILMKYVLIEHSGFNLRNNVSHSFMFRENYLLIHAHLIFLIILRIGAYKISPAIQDEA